MVQGRAHIQLPAHDQLDLNAAARPKIVPMRELVDSTLEALQVDAAKQVSQYSDLLLQPMPMQGSMLRTFFNGVLGREDRIERSFELLDTIRAAALDFRTAFQRLDNFSNLSAQMPGSRPIASANTLDESPRIDLLSLTLMESLNAAGQRSFITEAQESFIRASTILSELGAAESALTKFLKAERSMNELAERMGTSSQVSTLRFTTRFESAQDVPTLAGELAALAKPYHRSPKDSRVKQQGVAIAEQTPEVFGKHFKQGAQLITVREGEKIAGFALYYEPRKLPEFAKDVPQRYQAAPQAYVQWIMVGQEYAGTSVQHQLLNAVLIHLQRTGAAIATGRVFHGNTKAMAAHYRNGWQLNPEDTVTIQGKDGSEALFVGMQLPVSPSLRKRWGEFSPLLSTRYSDQIKALDRGALPVVARAAMELQQGALSESELVEALSTSVYPSVVRITGGVGSMTARAWKGAAQLFQGAFEGFAGAMIYGGTRMLVNNELGATAASRSGITEIPALLRQSSNGAVYGAIVIGQHTATSDPHGTLLSDSRVWNDELSQWEEKPFRTIKHPDAELYTVVDEMQGFSNKWHAEVHSSVRIVSALVDESNYAPLLIAYGGGATTEYEIKIWADKKWPIVLMKGSGGVTDKLIEDERFLAQNPQVMVTDRSYRDLRDALVATGIIEVPSLIGVGLE